MRLVSVNVSEPREIEYRGQVVRTGIFKEPVSGRVGVGRLNIDGDGQADLKVHGGYDMAVYAYPLEHYRYWEKELGRDAFPYGQFGENLTVEGLLEDTVRVGDVFRMGASRLQVTQPRIPCYKLAIRMDQEMDFPKRFQDSGRSGFYFRVLEEGEIGAGDAIELLERDTRSATIAEFIAIYLHRSNDPESLRRMLAARGLGSAWRVWFKTMLQKAEPVPTESGWEGYRTFVVDRKVPESDTITSFYLRPKDEEPLPPHRPGQFLTFRLDIPDKARPVTRTYTISDAPHAEYYRVSIKRELSPADRPEFPPDLSSNYFHDCVVPGTELCVQASRGDFWLDPQDDTPVVLLSGGVSLTPMISMLNAIVAQDSAWPVWFIHGARNGGEHAMGAHVRGMAVGHDNVHVHIRYSEPRSDDVEGRDYEGPGHVTLPLLQGLLPPAAYDFYLCGPPPFMKSLYRGLLDWGVPESRIHYEFFGPATVLEETTGPTAEVAALSAEGQQVTFARTGVTATWDASVESILELAESNGLHPDYSCRSGICHTCMSRLLEGEVEYTIEPADIPDPGSVLICCPRPKTGVVIDI
ncbi:MAG: MOSC domain-containing protein [Pseudomonadota bacterium]|nr:MOSC domain-containing protein [Pseudomonadota bacterium]